MPSRPNLLWICTDQQRFDTIHALGNPHIRTPNVDRLVAEGVTFTRAYSQSPVCTPSRACFLTGRYPRTTRCRQNGQDFPSDEPLITKALADAGYDCGLVGKLHLSAAQGRVEPRVDDGYRIFHWSHHPNPDWPENDYTKWHEAKGKKWDELYHRRGRNQVYPGVPAEYHQTTWCAEKTIEFLREQHEGPWLMSVNPFDPHHPFDPPQEYLHRMDIDAMPLPKYRPGELDSKPTFQRVDREGAYGGGGPSTRNMTEREQRELVAAYYAMVELIDDQLGGILAALERTGQRENTLILFHSDHGELLGDHGIMLKGPHFYDCSVRVPLILSWPGHFPAGLRSEALVELTDLVPTLLDAVGMETPERVQGKSLFPICTEAADPSRHRDHVYCEYYNAMPGHNHSAHGTMLREERYKVVVYHGRDEGELYDLQTDPDEFDNLWGRPECAELRMDMLKRCFDASVFTMDPMPPRVAGF